MQAGTTCSSDNDGEAQDFEEEVPVYEQVDTLIDFLEGWLAPPDLDLPQLMVALARDIASKGLWQQVG
jgi:hypothetical protein